MFVFRSTPEQACLPLDTQEVRMNNKERAEIWQDVFSNARADGRSIGDAIKLARAAVAVVEECAAASGAGRSILRKRRVRCVRFQSSERKT